MAENKRIVVVGIPGVGKTSLLAKMLEILGSKHRSVTVISFGTTGTSCEASPSQSKRSSKRRRHPG